MVEIKTGVCGIPRKLEKLDETIDVVEVQETFYNPKPEKYVLWRNRVKKLEFTVKAWFLITHGLNKRLLSKAKLLYDSFKETEGYGNLLPSKQNLEALETVFASARNLNATIIVFQTPPSFIPREPERIAEFFRHVENNGFIPVWEVRGVTLNYKEHLNLVSRVTEKLVLSTDILRERIPSYRNKLVYTRLHGLGGRYVNYKYKYTKEDLERLYASIIKYVKEQEKSLVYVLFNNVYMLDDAIQFKLLMKQLSVSDDEL